MTAPSSKVPYLVALQYIVRAGGVDPWYEESPIITIARDLGVAQKAVEYKLESLAERDYIEYGVSVWLPWLTEKGEQALRDNGLWPETSEDAKRILDESRFS